jgi:hypothetical protein
MLSAYPAGDPDGASLSGAAWVDLIDPTPDERAACEKALGLRVPTKEELGEIETTSRLQTDDGVLYMSAPLIFAGQNEPWIFVPTGFVLAKNVLMTVRFAQAASFDAVSKELGASGRFDPVLPLCAFWRNWSIIWPIFLSPVLAIWTRPRTSSSGTTTRGVCRTRPRSCASC